MYLSFVPDEETYTGHGMGLLCESEEFKSWNVGMAVDEGLARENSDMVVFYAERHCYWTDVRLFENLLRVVKLLLVLFVVLCSMLVHLTHGVCLVIEVTSICCA